MSTFAAVMTGRGMGAIATIQLTGDAAEAVLKRLFRETGDKPLESSVGQILLGHVLDGDEAVDQVTVGCESPGVFAIHCHGNPLIVERVMGLLQRNGAELLTAEEMLAKILAAQPSLNAVAVETRLALATVKTIAGAEILVHQIESGLSARIRRWQRQLGEVPLSQVRAEAEQILRDSEPARLIISGCTIALVGPPNTGKSTLLNVLAGREKSIVTNVRGTTRDWVSAEIHIPPLAVTLVDTAGLDPCFATGEIDQVAQQKSVAMIDRSDLVLLVLDLSQAADQLDKPLLDKLLNKKAIVVLNKADLPERFDCACLPSHLGQPVRISAKQRSGIDDLIDVIHQAWGLAGFSVHAAVVFTDRQRTLMKQLTEASSRRHADGLMSSLLHGPMA